ncbi:cytochrome o ubiquinol oxidase subunit IV [Stenotrophomonas sp. SY1]|jgi:cytochrome o ubiquinol oxidase operon protein cyoD|uniref:cytochrome o ubiquinol oxidase subunit IV n=1 Tax=Stenotrophomonas sp. SY1 TaxID=477235 RepID=UPI001E38CFE3|nr:cytochrome o ubiquinol oxidase subunit IV [Stenotrophomonas sp. SY1]MCD9087472.1 cytochrome o ubiquinol oxidase subunit IV [Stenotrophomonas sp. SY1]
MSAHDNHAHGAGGESHGSVKSYLIGFVLAAVLTIIPFWVVMSGGLSSSFATGAVIVVAGILQLLVHLVFFLHLDRSSAQRWNVNAGLFTLVVIGIIVLGTLWVMWNMNFHMMH